MMGFGISRYVLSSCVVAAMLAGCGGSPPPVSAPGALPQSQATAPYAERAHVHPAYSVIYSFKAAEDGEYPYASPINVNGTLYGTTFFGGGISGCMAACGTVFAVTTSGKEKVLHSFRGAGDGAYPLTGLLDVNGLLYPRAVLNHRALSIYVASAVLAACGGSQPPIGAPGSMQNRASNTKIFRYTGHRQTFIVPSGVDQLKVTVLGATGGSTEGSFGSVGGDGGRVKATIPVTPGEQLAIFVGGTGARLARLQRRWRWRNRQRFGQRGRGR